MHELIRIDTQDMTGASEQTCSARELHAFLDVGKDFTNWVKAQIERARLIEGRDFLKLAQKGELSATGQTRTEYHLTLDAAKHIAMMSGTEKGYQVREYFLACERRSKAQPATGAAPAIEALKLVPLAVRAARALGLDKNTAAISANQAVTKLTGTNVMQLLGHTHLDTAQQALYYTPTELGARLNISARKFNMLLAEAGLQAKKGEHWAPLPAAEGFCRILDTGKRHGDGSLIQQVKWADNVLALVQVDA